MASMPQNDLTILRIMSGLSYCRHFFTTTIDSTLQFNHKVDYKVIDYVDYFQIREIEDE